MRKSSFVHFVPALVLTAGLVGCAAPDGEEGVVTAESEPAALEIAPDVEERRERFAPTELRADLSSLTGEDRQVLGELVRAGRLMDEIFLRQVWVGNPEMRSRVERYDGPDAEPAREYFAINFGPWDRLDEMEAFLGDMEHPEGAGYYPVDMTKEEFESWIAEHPEDADAFRSLTTVIRRGEEGLVAIPYSTEYAEWLEPAAEHLRQAAETTSNETLARFLRTRADAFFSDDYYESDVAWMDLASPVEVTIGPYETYEDGLFGYKAAFEAFVTVDVPAESAKLEGYKSELPWLERNLPIPDEHKNFDRGTESPIRVVDIVFTGGDTKSGVQTIAFNLPNDERVREEKGSKKVLLRNIIEAKYEKILVPIGERVLVEDQIPNLSLGAYFDEVLHHELSHGLGPGKITKDGRETEVRLELEELYSTIEEAKADVMGVYDILALVGEGKMSEDLLRTLPPTYLAGLFRSARFGVHEAHGQGVVAQFNYLQEKGALEVTGEGRYRIVEDRFPGAIRDLLRELLMLQAEGDYEGTARFLETYGKPSEPLLAALGRLEDVPVDIDPVYPQAQELAPTE